VATDAAFPVYFLQLTMITGDNPLTACHVGKVLKFTGKNGCLILTKKAADEGSVTA